MKYKNKLILTVLAALMIMGCDMPIGQNHDAAVKKEDNVSAGTVRHEDVFGDLNLGGVEHPQNEIIFSLDQQKLVEFATAAAELRTMHSSLRATGVLQAAPAGQAMVTAPVSGHLVAHETSFPGFGDNVDRGEVLVKIIPRLEGEVDPTTLDLELRRSRSNHQLAGKELARIEELFRHGVVPERRLQEVRKEEQVARAELDSALERRNQFGSRPEKKNGAQHLSITSPISGSLDGVYVTPGAYVQEGDALFNIANSDILRLEIRIPEADIASLVNPHGAWFMVDGFTAPFRIDLDKGARLVALGTTIDPQSRTVPLVFEFPNTDNTLRIGMFVRAHVIIGAPVKTVAIPANAVQEHGGVAVVYVQIHADAFERRVVQLGFREGDIVQIKSGLKPGEKVVTRGAYQIQLAASGPQEAGHGHAH